MFDHVQCATSLLIGSVFLDNDGDFVITGIQSKVYSIQSLEGLTISILSSGRDYILSPALARMALHSTSIYQKPYPPVSDAH
jgi:hypothetical protein